MDSVLRDYICTVCANDDIGQNVCILKCRIPPVGCTAVSTAGDHDPDDPPRANWIPLNGKAGKKNLKAALPGVVLEPVKQTVLIEFGDDEPAIPEPRPVEPPAACLECETVGTCKTHDPKAEPMGEECHISAEKPPRKCCPTCRHHKAKKTFEETCPRLPELMFKGGKLSAMGLMLETSLKDCEHWQEKPAPVKKKKGKAKPLYQIHIAPSPPDSPALLDCGCKYIANTDVLYGSHEGHGGPQATKEEVIQSVLKDLKQFQKFDSILERDRDPITQKNTNFVDETGEFVIGDFFTSLGSPWPPNAEKRSTSKKSKKPQEETES